MMIAAEIIGGRKVAPSPSSNNTKTNTNNIKPSTNNGNIVIVYNDGGSQRIYKPNPKQYYQIQEYLNNVPSAEDDITQISKYLLVQTMQRQNKSFKLMKI